MNILADIVNTHERRRLRVGAWWAVFGLVLLSPAEAIAVPIEFSFTGTVTEKNTYRRTALGNDYRLVPTERLGTIPVGASFSGSYIFELEQPDLNPTDTYADLQFSPGSIGEYLFESGKLALADFMFMLLLPPPDGVYPNPINIVNGVSGVHAYVLSASTLGPAVEDYTAKSFGFFVDYDQGSDALSEIPPTGISSSNTRPVTFLFAGGREGLLDDVVVRGAFTSFTSARAINVPLPGTFALFLAALAGLVHGTRRSR